MGEMVDTVEFCLDERGVSLGAFFVLSSFCTLGKLYCDIAPISLMISSPRLVFVFFFSVTTSRYTILITFLISSLYLP